MPDSLELAKANHGELGLGKGLAAVQLSIRRSEPDVAKSNKGNGLLEGRELWAVLSGEPAPCLEQEYFWLTVTWYGRICRQRRLSNRSAEATVEEHTWFFGSRAVETSPEQIERWLRRHWPIENGIFQVLDFSYDQDRLYARKTGIDFSKVRQATVNMI